MFIFLQEHWLPHHEANSKLCKDFLDYNFLSTSSDIFTPAEDKMLESGPTWHGTALGWAKQSDKFISKVPIISERFCGVKYSDQITHTYILAYTAYLPTSGQDDEFLEVLSQLSFDIKNNCDENCSILIGLDSNQSDKSTRRRTDAMSKFSAQFSFKNVLISDKPTFHHNNQTSVSQIDQILYYVPEDSKVNVKMHKHLCKLENFSNLSSHDVIVGEVNMPLVTYPNIEPDYTSTYTPFVVAKPKWNESGLAGYQKQSAEVLQNLVNQFNQPEYIPMLTELFSKMLVISAEKNFETVIPKTKNHTHKTPYISLQHKVAYIAHEKVCKEWRIQGRPQDASHPAKIAKLESQRKLQRIAREEDALKAHKNHDDLMSTFKLNISQVCNKLKKIRGENIKSVDIPFIETLNGTYSGSNVLEGFCSNTETLCNDESESENLNHNFYKMCIEDNMIIFDITCQESIKIPHMTLPNLKDILFKKLKLNKACDIYKLTVEHLRYAGDETLSLILFLLNSIIDNINYLSSTQLNTAAASIVYKGKKKPVYHHKSYRQVRVTPLLGRCLDEFIRPNLVKITKPIQNSSQYGFTLDVTYMMGALQRHEVEKFCIDSKKTFFGCSLDGDSAFEVVNRAIQTRELYCAGERGQYWLASKYSYENTQTQIKMNGQLSRNIIEKRGVKQGHIKSSDNYKIYINPLLDTVDSACLGVWVGPINVGSSACADDEYLMSDSQSKLQALLDIAAFYGKMYRVTYGAAKTKVTVVGSEIDMQYYRDVTPWNMDGQKVKVTEDNDHLGQIVSGVSQELKNVDTRIDKGRKSLFGMLGAAFAFKCLLSPKVKIHLFRTHTTPILRSGLSSFSLRTTSLEPLTIFHRKTLRGILNLSKSSNIPALHFLLGELPIEGQIHREVFSLFYSVWSNPDSKIYKIVKYLLEASLDNSRTWSVHLRFLSKKYGLADPLECLKVDPPSKSQYKENILTKVCAHFEKSLRTKADTNSRLKYLNVSLSGLRGRHHPALADIITTTEVKKSRIHIKMLAGDYFTYEVKSNQSGGSPHCRCCSTTPSPINEDLAHILTSCAAYSTIRNRIVPQYRNLCTQAKSIISFEQIYSESESFCQFILDPASFNLSKRIHMNDPILGPLFKLSRDYCYAINSARMKILKTKQEQKNNTLIC